MNKELAIIVAALIVVGGLALFAPSVPNVNVNVPENYGAQPGPDHYNAETFYNTVDIEDTVTIDDNASTTLIVGDESTGCLILGHSVSGDPVYVTTVSSTISATTTKPSICK